MLELAAPPSKIRWQPHVYVRRLEKMGTEREKMLAGELYDPLDPELAAARRRARDLCHALNATRESEDDRLRSIVRALFSAGGDSVWMQPPFFCDYGSHIEWATCHAGQCNYDFRRRPRESGPMPPRLSGPDQVRSETADAAAGGRARRRSRAVTKEDDAATEA